MIFVGEARDGVDETKAMQAATRLAAHMMRICSDTTVEGTIWEVDANLRPEGRNGPLVRTLSSHLAYYQRWAKTWEFQALLKARAVAGDPELGAEYVDAVSPLVWGAADRENFVPDVQKMRRRVVDNIPADRIERELKLGPGGLRDVEFAVQLLQLVHGRSDASLHSGSTLEALRALAEGGYVGRADAAQLDEAYRFLRAMEHRIQLYRLRRTHLVPEDEADLRRLGRSLGMRTDPVAELNKAWKRHASVVRRLHEKIFYRPLLDAVAQLAPGESRLSAKAAAIRLEALGYADPAAALRHLEALSSGVTRKAAIQRTLLPVLLGWFADSADPDAGLLGFRKVSDALGKTPWYLRLLRDEGAAAENLARVLSAGRLAPTSSCGPGGGGDPGRSGGAEAAHPGAPEQEVLAAVGRAGDAESAVAVVRGAPPGAVPYDGRRSHRLVRHRGQPRRAGPRGPRRPRRLRRHRPQRRHHRGRTAGRRTRAVGRHPADSGSPSSAWALRRTRAELRLRRRRPLFVHQPREGVSDEEAGRAANAVVGEMRRLLQPPTADPPLLIDADLRPEGRTGPMVRTLKSYEAYYRRWSLVWESQALLRAEHMAGDAELGRAFVELVDPLRYPMEGLGEDAVREIRRLKARMESERMPRGADPTLHAKLGRGGLSDVEWTVQLIQMQHGWAEPGLRTTRTREALAAACAAGLIPAVEAQTLDEAWVLAARVRNAVMLVRGRPGDTFPSDARELAAVGRYLGYEPRPRRGHAGRLPADHPAGSGGGGERFYGAAG